LVVVSAVWFALSLSFQPALFLCPSIRFLS
jgi:hypothetical protein